MAPNDPEVAALSRTEQLLRALRGSEQVLLGSPWSGRCVRALDAEAGALHLYGREHSPANEPGGGAWRLNRT